ncbi:MAG: cold shock protein (beta-ribbon, CspA family) [Parcubacteria group bacterium LiPW_41]|nr:MAG: cold shock protein (beta-ribbon, CspA family) [Parcubacteria group bacterium LiPW_41]
MEGTIKNLVEEKGFGFITVDGEAKDLFFHSNELKGVSFNELQRGDRVSFEKADSPKGPNAVNVTRI